MPMLAKKSTITPTKREGTLIQHVFDDPVLQAEFEALNNNQDRLDYISGIEAIASLEHETTLSHEEVLLNALGLK
jgi:hypothetical protein